MVYTIATTIKGCRPSVTASSSAGLSVCTSVDLSVWMSFSIDNRGEDGLETCAYAATESVTRSRLLWQVGYEGCNILK